MSTAAITPPPPGYTLDSVVPPPPPGYTLDAAPSAQQQPSLWSNPREYLTQRAGELQQEAQRQVNMGVGPESEGRSFLNRAGHQLLSLVPETGAVIDKAVAGLMDPKTAAAVGAGVVNPAIPAAYFGTQSLSGLLGIGQPGPGSIQRAIQNPSPENVQQPLMEGSVLAGSAAGGLSSRAPANPVQAARSWFPGNQANVIPEARNLPSQAVSGAEKVYRAAAPVGSDPQFRSNLYAAAGDLAEIGRDVNLAKAKGGVLPGNPDLRVRATVKAINDHLKEMYQQERAPQIARNADAPVVPQFGEDATSGLEYLSKNAGTAADRALATRALSSESMPLAAVDKLARAVNRELSPLRGMTPQELAVSEGNSRRMGSLQALDSDLSKAIGTELTNRGEGGIGLYERRYAGLSSVRDQLQSRMNAVELQRSNPVARTVGPFVKAVTGGKAGIVSASQASVADVNIGRTLQQGLNELAASGLRANRAYGRGAPPVRGLLTPGATQLPSEMEPLGQPSTAPPLLPYQPSVQTPGQFISPAAIRPAAPLSSLLWPEGDLFQFNVNSQKR